MQGMGSGDCPFTFNTDPQTFMVGDTVSYRVEGMDGFPFAGRLLEVHDRHVVLTTDLEGRNDGEVYRASREDRPLVTADQIA
ncbi:hypothetical protein [Croceicoccus naphthovorans]|uniref:Uncharacterized protein n=1 Tax=Croceicoccus naphthovorans TaxID=1348774 RepID=A0A0G3XFP8_9SPHN|nr:hypothetical protein [Croceicoccus naphthovorans]AKM09183.1 hypothetical protein AB433_03085 [Croceicoccus naphthovorans]MBB3990443.1 hypothetical protein [Croceicoccus naphthovorans]